MIKTDGIPEGGVAEVSRPDLDAIRRRVELATKGPWTWEAPHSEDDSRYQHILAVGGNNPDCGRGIADTYHAPSAKIPWDGKLDYIPPRHGRIEDADFIAHARQDIPALLSYIERCEADSRRLDWVGRYWKQIIVTPPDGGRSTWYANPDSDDSIRNRIDRQDSGEAA